MAAYNVLQDKTIFVGIDVHKRTYSVTVVNSQGQDLKRASMEARPEALVAFLKKFFPGVKIKSVYEAGCMGFVLHRQLVANGIENIIVHAAHVEVSARDRVKTDKRDSKKLATQLAAGRLSGVFVPTPEQEDRRSLTRLRESLVQERTRTGLRIKSQLMLLGLIDINDTRRICRKWIESVREIRTGPYVRKVLDSLISLWVTIDDQVKEVTAAFRIQAKADSEIDAIYQSVPGMGTVISRTLMNELGDMSQFSKENHLFSYSGFTPSEFSSGEHRRQGHITRQGKPIIRKMMVQVAWVAIKKDARLAELFQRLAKRAGKKRAIVAIARRMLGHLRACLRHRVAYKTQAIQLSQDAAA